MLRLAIPNLVTCLAMYAGLTAVRLAIEGRFAGAAIALAVAGLADRLDGAAARLLRVASRFGAEFDSFADVISFGVAPALVMYLWALRPWAAWGFLPAVLFILCAALRLTRFNLDTRTKYPPHFYTGMTSPPGAAIAAFPLLTALEAQNLGWPQLATLAHTPLVAVAFLLLGGLLMIAPFPLLDFVHVRIPLPTKLAVLAGFLLLMAVQPWLGLMLLAPFALFMLAISPWALRRRLNPQ